MRRIFGGAAPRARLAAALVALALFACGGGVENKTSAPACVPGRSVGCQGSDGCSGHQVCKDDGSAYDVCVCSTPSESGGGGGSGLIGAGCVADADCGDVFSCLTSTSDLLDHEGPSGGLCTLDCAKDHGGCEKADPGSTCVVLDDRGTDDASDDIAVCFPTCKLGDPTLEDDKCRGRDDLVCAERTAGTGLGYCRPACRADQDCGERRCDLSTGLCGSKAPSGDPIGAKCDLAAPACQGGCIDHGSGYAECSGVCSFGTPGCGQQPAAGPPYDYLCLLDPSNHGGKGDLGYCTQLCDCDDDCGRADAVCQPRDTLEVESGRKGVCGSVTYASGAARPNLPCR